MNETNEEWEREEETEVVWTSGSRDPDEPEWVARVWHDSEGDCWRWWVSYDDSQAEGSIEQGDDDRGPDDDRPEGLIRAQAIAEGALKLMREFGGAPT